jgi:hypothetical protein
VERAVGRAVERAVTRAADSEESIAKSESKLQNFSTTGKDAFV